MPLDPQVQRYLARQATAGQAPGTPAARREARRIESILQVEDRTIPGPGGPLPIRVYSPPGPRPLPLLLYLHGGGWVTGDLDVTDFQCRLLARWSECIVVHVNYRHAPEHPFPAAVEDAYAGLCWVAANAESLSADSQRIAVGGDSAGANLAAAVTLLARERDGPSLVFQYLAYPVTDGSMAMPSMQSNATGYGLSADAMAWYWDQYVPDRAERQNPLASPLAAPDLSDLPPAFVMTAEFDPLRDEGEAYAARLADAGVAVQMKRYDGLIHGFLGQTPDIDAARAAMADLASALRTALLRQD